MLSLYAPASRFCCNIGRKFEFQLFEFTFTENYSETFLSICTRNLVHSENKHKRIIIVVVRCIMNIIKIRRFLSLLYRE